MNPDEMVKELQEHRIEAQELESKLRDYLFAYHNKLLKYPPDSLYREMYIFPTIGGLECPESPIKICCYDWVLDSAHDHCIFCHQPEERK